MIMLDCIDLGLDKMKLPPEDIVPEECVVFNADLPQFFGCPVIRQLEANGGLKLFKLSWSNFYIKVVPFVGNLENFRPSKTIDS